MKVITLLVSLIVAVISISVHAQSLDARSMSLHTQPQSAPDSVSCAVLWDKVWVYSDHNEYQLLYDTGRYLVEHCYDNMSYIRSMFGMLLSAAQALSHSDTSMYVQYRQWLASVLYLNTKDPDYFCLCAVNIAQTYHSYSDTSETLYWKDQNRSLAIARWLLQNTNCDSLGDHGIFAGYNATRASQYSAWLNDTTVPFDTTLPSMHELGLDTLFARHFLYASVGETMGPELITSVVASPNPAIEGTLISFGLRKEAYVKLELFDVIGHRVEIPPMECLFEAGNRAIPLSLHGLPSGTYYARLVTAYGEAQTVKIVKQ